MEIGIKDCHYEMQGVTREGHEDVEEQGKILTAASFTVDTPYMDVLRCLYPVFKRIDPTLVR